MPCVLDDDLKRHVAEILRSRKPAERIIDGFVVHVPKRFAKKTMDEANWFPRWLSVAPMLAYDREIGFDEANSPRPEVVTHEQEERRRAGHVPSPGVFSGHSPEPEWLRKE